MCDCFHLVLPNWPGSPASASGRQLRPEDTEADGEADVEDDSINDEEVTTENIRPRPQGSSPVYEYCIDDEYFNKKLQQDRENRQRRDSSIKMSESQESMEVTLQTEVESGASGFSVAGGGSEGIFVKQVLKESPASKVFSLKEGDQLLSATIFFDNIKYEDALKILQYSEPYKVQFNLKRKLVGKEEMESMYSAKQSKKEKLIQGKEILEISEKMVSEEDKANLIVKQRVGRPKRTKKDRLSWPKFQSMKGKRILGHRRSRSTSDAYEHTIPDISPTSTDTESQFQQEELHAKIKKGSQKRLKFPSIGFKMYKSKQETEERTKYEVKPLTEFENDTTGEITELITTQYSTKWDEHGMKEGKEKHVITVMETKPELQHPPKKCPEVELTIKKPKDKKMKSGKATTETETAIITSQIMSALQTNEGQPKMATQSLPKTRKKKHKGSKEKIELETEGEKGKKQKQGIKEKTAEKIKDANIMITPPHMRAHISEATCEATGQASFQLEPPELQVEASSEQIALDSAKVKLEDMDSKFKMPKLHMPRFAVSLPKGKPTLEEETALSSMDTEVNKKEMKGDVTLPSVTVKEDIMFPKAKTEAMSLEVEVTEKGKFKMPDVKMPSVQMPQGKTPQVGVSLPKVEADISLPKGKIELPEGEVSVMVSEAEGSVGGGGMKIHMPKFKMPSMGFSKTDIKGPKVDVDLSLPKVDVTLPSADLSITKQEPKTGDLQADISVSGPDVHVPSGEATLELKAPELQMEAPAAQIALDGTEVKLEGVDSRFKMPKFHMPKFGVSLPKGWSTAEGEIVLPSIDVEVTKPELKADVALPSVGIEGDIKLPQAEIEAPSFEVELEEKGKFKTPDVKMPSVKMPKGKTPQVGVNLPKVEADVSLPKGQIELPETEVSVKDPKAEGSVEGGGMKIHMPKFKMPSLGFSKTEVKGPKLDVDLSLQKVDVTLPSADLSITKPELKSGDLQEGISVSGPDVHVPSGEATLELKAPELQMEAPAAQIALDGTEVKLEGVDSRFKIPKFHMPKFGVSLPKGWSTAEGEIVLPSIDVEVTKPELKADVALPSVGIEGDIKLPQAEIEPPSFEVELEEKGIFKTPDVKMPSVKMPKGKTPQVGVNLPKVEADISLPKGKIELPETEVSVKDPKAEGSVEGGGMKIHMPKFKMPSLGFSKTDVKGPKLDVDLSLPKVDVTFPSADLSITKPELKTGDLQAGISVSGPDVHVPSGEATVELKAPELQMEAPAAQIALDGTEVKLEGVDSRFKMPKFHMPKFGVSLPKGKSTGEGEIVLPSVDVEFTKPELKEDVDLPSVGVVGEIKLPQAEIEAPSLEVELGEKGKYKMSDVKMPRAKMPKGKTRQVGVSLPKVEADVSLPKGKIKLPEAEVSVKVPEAEGSVEGGGMKIHMPKFKMPSMGFSKTDVKGPKLDVDLSLPKVDVTLPSADLSITKQEPKTGDLQADISVSGPDVHVPSGEATLELKAPELQMEAPAAQIALDGTEVKLEGVDSRFKMPKFHMPKFGVSLPKGWSTAEGEIVLPSIDVEVTKPELKADVALPSVGIEGDIKLPQAEIEAPSFEVELEEKGKFKSPDVKMPSVKMPKGKTPQVGVNLPKVEADVSLPKGQIELPETEVSVKDPKAEGSVEGGGMKIHMPKFKMPSLGFSKTDVKGPKLDVDLSLPKVDVTLPSADLSITKPELKSGDLQEGISISGPDVHVPSDEATLEWKAPELQMEAPASQIALDGTKVKLEGVDSRFKMPKFHMPKFGVSLPKGKSTAEGEIVLPSVDVEVTKPELKADVDLPSVGVEGEIKLPQAEIEALSLEVELGEKGKFKMPDVKMPCAKMPKGKTQQVGVSLHKVEADVSLPKGKIELPEAEVSVKVPEAEGSVEGGGMKIHMPKFKMPSLGFSKTDVKGPKLDVDLSLPKVDVTFPSADLSITKPELKTGDLQAGISVSGPDVHIPSGEATLELKAPELQMEAPAAQIALDGTEVKLEGVDSRFKMPKFHMPKFGVSLPKGKSTGEGEIVLPSVDVEFTKPELKEDVDLPSVGVVGEIKLPQAEIEAPSLEVELGEKGKYKMSDVKMPRAKMPKSKTRQVGVSLPKVEADVSLPKGKIKLPEAEVSVKVPEAEASVEGGGMKIHMPKFKMPSMGFSKTDVKGPKLDVDLSLPKVDVTLPSADLSITKQEPKTGDLQADISVSGPDVHVPSGEATLELKAPELQMEAPAAQIALDGTEVKLEGVDSRFKMPKFHMPKFGVSLPKGWSTAEGEIVLPSVDVEVTKPELKADVAPASVGIEGDIKLPQAEIEAPSFEVELEEKGKFKTPDVKMPSVKMPKGKTPQVGVNLPKVEADVSLPKGQIELPETEVSVKDPKAEGSVEGGGMKIHMPKFKMPSLGFSKTDVKGPKLDVDLSLPKVDVTFPSADLSITKPELKTGDLQAGICISGPDVHVPSGEATLELKAPELQMEAPAAQIALDGTEVKLEGVDSRFKMPKFHMPKFGVSLPKGKSTAEGEIVFPSVDVEFTKPELKADVDLPSVGVVGEIKLPQAEIEAPSLEVELGEKGKFKMPDVKMPSAKMPKGKTRQVGVSLPKVEADVSLPRGKIKLPEAEVSVKVPEAEGSVEGGGMKIHMPKFKMPSMGFSKTDVKGPKVDVDLSLPKVDVTLPSADLSITKQEPKKGDLHADISVSGPDVHVPSGEATLELKAPELQMEAPAAQIALDGTEVKLEGVDSRFKMPKFHMPKFGVSLPKGWSTAEGEIILPSVDVEVTKPELKADVALPSVGIEGDIKLPQAEIEAPSFEVELEEKGKFKTPDVKMPSVKMPKGKTPQVGVNLPKVEADVSLPKGQIELPETEVSVKDPKAEGSVEGGGMKIHMPKFKMPSMGFSKTDVKGPKVDVDLSLPKVDVTLPSADLSITKQELKTGDLHADISVSGPDVHVPSGEATLELKAPELQMEAPAAQIALDGTEVKLEGVDSRFKMPKFHMPKFGVSLPKGWSTAEGEIILPSVDVEVTKPELKADVALPSVGIEGDIKLPQAEIEAPSFEVELEEKGKFKTPDVKMPSVKMPKGKTPQVGVNLPKVEADVSLPKGQIELPETKVSVKDPKAEGSVEGGGMKIHMPKFKMPSLGFSKTDVKGPKLDVDLSLPKVDVTFPSADLSITKPELKTGDLQAGICISGPDVHVPSGEATLELKAPELQMEAPAAQIALDGTEVKLEGVDSRFKMPKFHMPKFGVSLPKGKSTAEGEIVLPSVDVEFTKPELKEDVDLPSVGVVGEIKLPQAEIEAPSLEVELGEKGKFKMPDVKMPSAKMPKGKTQQVGVSLPKVEADVSLPRGKIKLPEAEVSVKVPEAEGSVEGGGMKIHMPKFKMPSMGFSKTDVKGPKVDVDLSLPKVDVTLPSADLSITKQEPKTGDLHADISVSGPDVHVPSGEATLELKAPELQMEAPAAQIALDGTEVKLEGVDSRFKMPKFHMPKFGVSLPKGWSTAEGEIILPSVDVEVTKPELKADVALPSVGIEGDIKLPQAEIEAPSFEVELEEKGKFKTPDVKMPSVKMPKGKTPQVGVNLPKVEADVSLPKDKIELPETEVSVKDPKAEGSVEGGGMKIHMPKFKMPSLGFSKTDVKGPKLDVDLSLQKVDVTLPSADLSITKPELKTGDLQADISVSGPDVHVSSGEATLALKAPELQMEAPAAQIALDGTEVKLEGVDSRFKMPKFHMPKFEVSLPKGKSTEEGEIVLPSVDAEVTKPELKADVALPSVGVEGEIKLPQAEIEAPSFEVELEEKGKFKMPDVKMPSAKMPKGKTRQVGVSLPKVEADVSLPKGKIKLPEAEVSVKVPEAEGSVEGGGMKIHMPKFKMPSMGFSKTDVKGPKLDVDLSLPKVDVTLPSADLSITKPELKTGDLQADIGVSGPDVHVPSGEATLELKAPELQMEAPAAQIALDGTEVKLEGVDSRFKMPKFHMPKFEVSLPKGKSTAEGEIVLPSVDVEVTKPELKADVALPSVGVEGDIKLAQAEIEAPGLEVELGEKGKFKMTDVKMPRAKMPKGKTRQVGVSLPKVEADVSLPKGKIKLPEAEVSVKVPEAEGSVEGGGMKIHMPKFKMPSMGFSKTDIKGPKLDVDLSLPKVDVTLPSADLSITKQEPKTGDLQADISVSGPDVHVPSGEATVELKAPELQMEAPAAQIALDGTEVKLEGVDSRFKMPKFHMPKFGVSLPKGWSTAEGEIVLPSIDVEVTKPELKADVALPSVGIEGDIKLPQAEIEAPSFEVELEEKGKFKSPDVKMPSIKMPKCKTPKVDSDISFPKGKINLPEREISVKVPEAEGSVEGGRMKIHMPKFSMPSMGFSKTDVKGPKPDVDLSLPKVDATLPSADLSITKPELKTGDLQTDIGISVPDVHIPSGEASLELKAPELQMDTPAAPIALDGTEVKLEGVDSRFKMPKFHMPRFGMSRPKGKAAAEGELALPSLNVEVTKPELKADVTLPSVGVEGDIKLPQTEIEAASLEVEGKFKMPDVKIPSVQMPQGKTQQVGVSLPKVEADVSLPKGKIELPEGEVSVKVPEAEGIVEGGGMKIHKQKFKMPSMGFSKTDVKGPKVDVDLSLPKVDVTLPSADFSITKPELKTGDLQTDISVSGPDVHVPSGEASLELKAPELQMETPAAQIALDGSEVKLEGVDSRFKMPKFHMPRFGMSRPKGKAAAQGALPSLDVEVTEPELKTDVTLPSVGVEGDIKLPQVEIEGPSLEVEGKFKMPDVKMPSVQMPQGKTPQVGVSLPKVEADVSLRKGKIELPEGEVSVMVSEAEGSVEGGGMKIHMPKFKMPSMGFSKQDAKGPKVDLDLSLPKVDVTLPSADLSITKPELKTGDLQTDISVSGPDVHVPSGEASLELKAPELQMETPAAQIALDSTEVKLEGVDSRFKMPKFHMPRFGMSRPKGKATAEGELVLPSLDVEVTKPELKTDVTLPSVEVESDIKLPQVEIEGPSLEVEGKFKMPDVKMPSIKMPQAKTPQVGVSLPKVEADVSLPKGKIELPEGEVSVKVPEAEGSVEGGEMKIHMPKFKMPSMGFSKTDIKGPKVDVDLSLPKVDVTLPSADFSITKPELKTGDLQTDIGVSGPDVHVPSGEASLELKAPELQMEASAAQIALDGSEVKLEGVDSRFKMPKFHMPRFGMSRPKGKAAAQGELALPSLDVEVTKPELKTDVTLPSVEVESDIKLPQVEIEGPSLEVEGKFKMPDVKMPSIKMHQAKTPQVGVSLPKVEADVSLPKGKIELPEGEVSVKVPEAEGSVEGGGMKIHMPKFKMPSMGFSKQDAKGPKVDVDLSLPKVDVTLPSTDLSITKPELKTGDLQTDINVSSAEVHVPSGQTSLELKAPDLQIEVPAAEIALDATEAKLEGVDSRFKMPKFHMPRFGMSRPKGKATAEDELALPCTDDEKTKPELKADVTVPSFESEGDIKLPQAEIEAPSLEVEVGEKGKIKMPDVKVPSIKMPKTQTPEVGASLPKVEADVSLPKGKIELPEAGVSVKVPELEGSMEDGGMKMHMPKFKMPVMDFSKPDVKGPNIDMDLSLPKVDATLPVGDVSITKSAIKTDELQTDGEITKSQPLEKDTAEKESKFKMPKFKLPSFSWSPKKETSLSAHIGANLDDSSIAVSTQEPELTLTVEEVTASDVKKGIKMSKVKLPSLEFSKPEIKAPKMDMEASLTKSDIQVPTLDIGLSEPVIRPGDISGDFSKAAAEIKVPMIKSPEVSLERLSTEISVDGAELRSVTNDGKIKRSKFQMPKFGISFPKGKVPEAGISLPSEGIDVPQLKTTTDIGDIAVEAPTYEVEYDSTCAEKKVLEENIKISQIPTADLKTAVDIKVPSDGFSLEQPETETPFSDATETKPEKEMKTGSLDAEQKEGNFKMPKFKLPSFNWSPKKEATIKTNIKESLEEPKLTAYTDAELKIVLSQDQEVQMDEDAESSIKKSQSKRSHFIMPKISLTKTKLAKSQDKVETDITVERDGDVVQIPDIESSFTTKKEEEMEISIKMPKGISKSELKAPHVDTDITLSKGGIEVYTVDSSSEMRSSEIGLEGDIVVERGSVTTEDKEGKIRLLKLQMPKFGIAVPKQEWPESSITSTEMESRVPQKQLTIETDGLSGEIPTLEVKTDASDTKVSAGKIKMAQTARGEIKASDSSVVSPDEKDVKSQGELEAKSGEVQIEDSQGWFKMPKFRMPSFGRSKGKKDDIEVEVSTGKAPIAEGELEISASEVEIESAHVDMESCAGKNLFEGKEITDSGISVQKEKEFDVGLLDEGRLSQLSGKADHKLTALGTKITEEDFEIIDFPIEGFEKDALTEDKVKVEDADGLSKAKTSKFKMPKFGNLRTKPKVSEVLIEPAKMEIEGTPGITEDVILGIQTQSGVCSADMKITKTDFTEEPIEFIDKHFEDSEQSFHITKFKMPKFIYRTSTVEEQSLPSEGTVDKKSTGIDTDSALQPEFRTTLLEEKIESQDSVQKSKVKITTLSEPTIQRTHMESKLPSTESSFEETTHIKRPTEFSCGFPAEIKQTTDGKIQKSVAKISTVREPDIQTTQLEIKLPSDESFISSKPLPMQGPYKKSKEIKIVSKSEFSKGDEEESFSTQIVRESEIPPSEVKTAAYGFSLLKVKIQESHVTVDKPVKLSSAEYMNETFESKDHQPSDESSEQPTQKTGFTEMKLSHKGEDSGFTEGLTSTTTLTKVKAFTVEVQSSSDFSESHHDKHPEEMSESAIAVTEETKIVRTEAEPTDQKEKSDSKRSPGRFKFWFQNIGYSSSADDATSDSKPEDQKSFPETEPDEPSTSESESSKQTEKAGWFRLPKLGFSSPTKKSKETGKEEDLDRTDKNQDDESPTEKTETFFDAQETLPPKDTITEKEGGEISGALPCEPIVSSSARTELILLEKEKATLQSIPEEASK
ncbi:neuroblast differentiation-associated protein AHNAK [Anolis carolinensis]|uniref:neuroblast differentiation-associated protein AHNAK n=1 Tax=Anolis carolinensis TaxID=28377 RepID=UPI002F2B3C9D